MNRARFRQRGFRGLLAVAWTLAALSAMPAVAQSGPRLTFIGVALDQDTRQADAILQDTLERNAGVTFAPEDLEYALALDRLANWQPEEGFYVARTTPYVYVAAEMLGADFEILATYRSVATASRTYSSYLVVNRTDFATEPTLEELIGWIRSRPQPARFIYHSKFSTSSFFLPSLTFRERNIFHMPESAGSLTAIHSRQIAENSSTRLVELVADGEADLAAVWDGTKARFESGHPGGRGETFGPKVWFVRLPTTLPNDLLVCSAGLDPATKDALRQAVAALGPEGIGYGDFLTWDSIREATDARTALAELRWAARERTAPVTVEILSSEIIGSQERGDTADVDPLVLAARQAVRLSGTEFRLYDEDFHAHVDYRWTVKWVHDEAMELRSLIPGSGLDEQVFQISFRDTNGLTGRIAAILRSRMHRIRYVWPYSDSAPIVFRDTATPLARGATVKVQRVTWMDPARNEFRQGPLFDARVTDSGFFRYQLEAQDFDQGGGDQAFDALSNVGHRVILVAPRVERRLFRVLTQTFLVLLALAALGALWDLVRRNRRDPYWNEPTRTSAVTRFRPDSTGGGPRASSGKGSGLGSGDELDSGIWS